MEGPGKIKHSRPVPPFLRWCSATIPAVFDDSLTYYEALCSLWKWLQTNLVEVVNNNATVTQEYIRMVDELKEFVDNYFENLDVQNEINNKLDSMAEDGTLADIVNAFITSEVRFYFPKFMENAYSQDFSVIVHDYDGDKTFIMVDCGVSTQWSYVLEMLTDSECSHIDYFILTHYDTDHYGNLENLINTHYIDENTIVYLPAQVTNYPSDVTSRMSSVNNLLSINNIPTQTHDENAIEEIGTLKLKFGNVGKSVVESHSLKNANAMSQVVLFEHKGSKILYNADATTEVQKMLFDNNFCPSSVDLFKCDHHLIDQYCNKDFIYSIAPKYAVQTSAIKDFVKNNYGICEEATILKNIGTKIYSSVMQSEKIIFTSKNGSVQCNVGHPKSLANTSANFDVYVDQEASQSSIQDGSSTHPYTEVMQAIGAIQNNIVGTVTIHVADGSYGYSHEAEGNKNRITLSIGRNCQINIVGESKTGTILNHVAVTSSNITFQDLTIDVDNGDGIYINRNSHVTLNNVNIKSKTDTLNTNYSGIVVREGSTLMASGDIYITQCNNGVVANNSYVLLGSKLTIGTLNSNPLYITQSEFLCYNVNFDNSSDAESFITQHRLINSPINILAANQQTNYQNVYDLTMNVNLFDWLEVYYLTNDGNKGSIKLNRTANDVYGEIINAHLGGSNANRFDKCIKARLHGKNLTFSLCRQYAYTASTGTITVSESENNIYFKVEKVIGGWF